MSHLSENSFKNRAWTLPNCRTLEARDPATTNSTNSKPGPGAPLPPKLLQVLRGHKELGGHGYMVNAQHRYVIAAAWSLSKLTQLSIRNPKGSNPEFVSPTAGAGGEINSPYYNRIPDTTTRSPILQPETGPYHNWAAICTKRVPTTTGTFSLLQLERSSLFSIGLCE